MSWRPTPPSAADVAALAADLAARTEPWRENLVELADDEVFDERESIGDEDVISCRVMAPVVGTTAGSYTFDLRAGSTTPGNGVSLLDGALDLTGLTPGAWTNVEVLTDGTQELVNGDKVRAWLVSDNADLTGFDDGVFFAVYFRQRG